MGKIVHTGIIITFWVYSSLAIAAKTDPTTGHFNEARLEKLSQFDGLSSSKIVSLLKDQKGFIWIGTDNGLNKFDGNEIKLFKEEIFPTEVSNDYKINCLYEDIRGLVWIGTRNGLYTFNEKDQSFEQHVINQTNGDFINALCEDKEGNLWISHNNGLTKYSQHNKKFSHIDFIKPESGDRLAMVIHSDSKGELWIGSWNKGIYRMNPITGEYLRYSVPGYREHEIFKTGHITDIAEGPDGSLWMGAWNYGLLHIDPERKSVNIHKQDYNNSNSINGTKIKALEFDDKGFLWIGIEESGLDKYAPESGNFTHYFNEFNTSDIYEGPSVYSILIDDQSLMWLGFRNDGVVKVPLDDPPFFNYKSQTSRDARVFSLCETEEGIFTGVKGAVELVSEGRRTIKTFKLPNNETPIALYPVSEREILLGTYKGSIFKLNTQTGQYAPCSNRSLQSELVNYKVESFYLLPDNKVLIGTQKGLCKLDLKTKEYKWIGNSWWVNTITPGSNEDLWIFSWRSAYQYYPQTGKQVDHEINIHGDIKSSFLRSESEVYLGTDLGFYRYNFENETAHKFSDIFPFVNNQINSIVADNQNNLWMTSESGLIYFNPVQKKFRTYTQADGLPKMRFYDGVGMKRENGEIVFGGEGGIVRFNPLKIVDHPNKATLTFTRLNIDNEKDERKFASVSNGTDISETDHLDLKYRQNIITFHFALLSYINPSKHRYKYLLEGFSDNWFDLGNSNSVTFTNLDPGEYVLKIQAANEENNWGPINSISIHVSPPIYQTWYAYIFYVLVLVGIYMLIRQFYSNREKLKSRLKDEHMNFEKMKAKAMHESEFSQMRLKFFTNISHEFRTPLTLILGPLENFIKTKKWPSDDHLRLMHKNAERLQRLINQLLDFRSMESQSLKFEPSWGNITQFAKETAQLFAPMAQQKGLEFHLTNNASDVHAWFDRDKVEKIIYNLLSNAHKHTQKGKIEFSIDNYTRDTLPYVSNKWKNPDYSVFVELTIKDSGEGIPKNKLPHIFDRFYHLQSNNTSVQGTGIGLTLTKELLEIHHGKIFVTSIIDEGSEFKVILPLKTERAADQKSEPATTSYDEEGNLYLNVIEQSEEDSEQSEVKLPVILIVEDNEDLRKYMRVEFGSKFTLLEADNGESGLEIALKEIPDLIISDLMMPKMDGIEFCKLIKKDQRTSHIPIIILTAHTSQFNKIRGYEIGADDYITKPFSSELLILRVENLLKGRKELQSKFSREVRLEPKDLQISSMDERFLTKAMEVVEANLNDSEFNADSFASEMCMSRVHLYRKLKALTDQSVSDFVKTARLKLAANLIGENKLTIKEAAYTVGFKDPKYFSKCFKQQFGVKPSDYVIKEEPTADE